MNITITLTEREAQEVIAHLWAIIETESDPASRRVQGRILDKIAKARSQSILDKSQSMEYIVAIRQGDGRWGYVSTPKRAATSPLPGGHTLTSTRNRAKVFRSRPNAEKVAMLVGGVVLP